MYKMLDEKVFTQFICTVVFLVFLFLSQKV